MARQVDELVAECLMWLIVLGVLGTIICLVVVPGCAAPSAGIKSNIDGAGNTVAPVTPQQSGGINFAYVAAAGAGGTLLATICWQLYTLVLTRMQHAASQTGEELDAIRDARLIEAARRDFLAAPLFAQASKD